MEGIDILPPITATHYKDGSFGISYHENGSTVKKATAKKDEDIIYWMKDGKMEARVF